jgi:hypothetical protein
MQVNEYFDGKGKPLKGLSFIVPIAKIYPATPTRSPSVAEIIAVLSKPGPCPGPSVFHPGPFTPLMHVRAILFD